MSPRIFLRSATLAFIVVTLLAPDTRLPAQSPPPPTTITATFWNVQWFPGRRPNASRAEENRQIRAVHADLARFDSDLVALEEVRDFRHAALAVKPLSGFKVDVCSDFPAREGQRETQQVAITSRLPPLSAWAEEWKPGAAITPPRGFAFAAYQLSPRQVLLVYALHLKSNRGDIREDSRIREESIHQLLSHMKVMDRAYNKLGALTWIVGGDFNTSPDDPRFVRERTVPNLLAGGFRWAWEGIPFPSRITVPADERYPPACFDHIFYRGAPLTKVWLAQTSRQSSDHRAVNATLSLK
jgi:endonuclease/exonuclease/phosphatase family metal-dependent hydrolase